MTSTPDAPTTARPLVMSQINTTAILELIRNDGPLSRADITRRTGLSGSTVTRLTSELLESQVIVEQPEPAASSGGRRPILLRFNHRAATLIGVDIGGTTTTAALGDLNGHILCKQSIPSRAASGTPIVPDDVIALVLAVAERARALNLPLRGVGIGAPGITRARQGFVVLAPALGWQSTPLGELVRAGTGLPTFVENDVNLGALGEHRFGAGRGTNHFVALLVGTGVGAGIIINGQLFHGAHDAAGEVGYLTIGRESLACAYPGFGHFESVAGGHGIAEHARRALADAGLEELEHLTARDVFALRETQPAAAAIVEQALDYMAIAVANIACLFNPERIVVGGGVVNPNPWVVDAIRERLAGRIPDLPAIVPAELGGAAVLVGALSLARERTSGYAFVATHGPAA